MKREDITKLFPEATEEQINALLNLNGTDLSNMRAQLKTANETLATLKAGPTADDLQAANKRAEDLQKELDTLKNAETLRQTREKVAGEKKIPVALLTAETEEDCVKQADAILAFANPGAYPAIKDGGEPTGAPAQPKTRDSFANWAEKLI